MRSRENVFAAAKYTQENRTFPSTKRSKSGTQTETEKDNFKNHDQLSKIGNPCLDPQSSCIPPLS